MSEGLEAKLETLLAEIRELKRSQEANFLPELSNFETAAKRIGISPATLFRWVKAGIVHAVDRGGSRWITASEIRRMGELEAKQARQLPERKPRVVQASAAERAAAARARAKQRR